MANLGGTQTMRATEGNEEKAKVLYRELREIIKGNTMQSLNSTIKEIAGVEPTSWANYIKTGNVSEFVVSNLAEFSGLPREIFACQKEFEQKEKDIFKEKIRERFGNTSKKEEQKVRLGEEDSVPYYVGLLGVEYLIKQIADQISNTANISSIEDLARVIEKLEKLVELAKTSKSLLEKKLEF